MHLNDGSSGQLRVFLIRCNDSIELSPDGSGGHESGEIFRVEGAVVVTACGLLPQCGLAETGCADVGEEGVAAEEVDAGEIG